LPNEDQKLDNLRPGSGEMEKGRWEGRNLQLGSSEPWRRRRVYAGYVYQTFMDDVTTHHARMMEEI
jgi:hypothetical protein